MVVVNNNSTDHTAEIAGSYPGVRVVDEKQKGLVSARDGGFKATSAELVANIDADTIVPEGWLDIVFEEFEKDPRLVCLSGPYIYYDLGGWNRFLVSMFYGLTWLIYVINHYILRVGSVVQGGNFVLKRDAWTRAGGFNRDIKSTRGHRCGGASQQARPGQIQLPAEDDDLGPPAGGRGRVPHRRHLHAELLLGHLRRQAGHQRAYRHPPRRALIGLLERRQFTQHRLFADHRGAFLPEEAVDGVAKPGMPDPVHE